MKYLVVKDWSEFQHYRDRMPPWIKLYNRLLDNYEFIELPESGRAHLVTLWLVASRHNGRIPYDPKYIARATHAKSKVDIARLVAAGFFTIEEQDASASAEQNASSALAHAEDVRGGGSAGDASATLAEREHDASPHARPRTRERESREAAEESETNTPRTAGAETASIAEAAFREAMGDQIEPVDRFLATRPERSRANWYPELLRLISPGMKASPADLAGACTDALIVDPPVTTPYALRAFLAKRLQERTMPREARPAAGTSSAPAARDALQVEAGNLVAQIRELVFDQPIPGQGSRRLLRNADVERLGDDVSRAYRTVGGAARFLSLEHKPDDVPYLIRDFANALRAARDPNAREVARAG